MLLLQRRGKGQRRCAIELGPEAHRVGDVDHLIMDVLGLAQYPVHAPLAIRPVPEADIAQDLTLLPQDGEVTTLFLLEGMRITEDPLQIDHLETPHRSENVITPEGLILQVTMLLIKMKMAMGMLRNLHMNLREHELGTGIHLVELQDHLLDLGLGLLTCHPGVADEVFEVVPLCILLQI